VNGGRAVNSGNNNGSSSHPTANRPAGGGGTTASSSSSASSAAKFSSAPSKQHQHQPTGGANPSSPTSPSQAFSPEAVALRERYLHSLLLSVGQTVVVHMRDGTAVEGVLHTASPFPRLTSEFANKYVLRAAIQRDAAGAVVAKHPVRVIDMKDASQLVVKSVRLDAGGTSPGAAAANGSGGGPAPAPAFTDSEIARTGGGTSAASAKALQEAGATWTGGDLPSPAVSGSLAPAPSSRPNPPTNSRAEALMGKSKAPSTAATTGGPPAAAPGTSSDSGAASSSNAAAGPLAGSIGKWDQFHANEKLFNVKGSFDENLYTTQLDKSKLDTSLIKEAERLAREIESTVSTNLHLKQERNQAIEGDYDEEDLFSGVMAEDRDATKTKAGSVGAAKASAPAPSGGKSGPTKAGSAGGAVGKGPSKTPPKNRPTAATVPSAGSDAASGGAPQPPKKMNYAAAAAKTVPPGFISKKEDGASEAKTGEGDAAVKVSAEPKLDAAAPPAGEASKPQQAKVVPSVESESKTEAKDSAKPSAEPATSAKDVDEAKAPAPADGKAASEAAKETAPKTTSKLNVNAKSFTFNINAKAFTPGGSAGVDASSAVPQPPISQHPQHQHPQLMLQHPQQPLPMQPYGYDPSTGMPYMVDPNMPMAHHMYPPMGQPGENRFAGKMRLSSFVL
jgi:LsmAD domain